MKPKLKRSAQTSFGLLIPISQPKTAPRFLARLTHLDGEKLGKLSLSVRQRLLPHNSELKRRAGRSRQLRQNGQAPPGPALYHLYSATRSLSQAGLFSQPDNANCTETFEGINLGSETTGLITYMRTDGVQMSFEAIGQIRDAIGQTIGAEFVPEKPRVYKSKAANAQEAHEAIRPTSIWRHPDEVRKRLDFDQFRLYELIWKRAIASQMADAQLDQTAADLSATTDHITMRAKRVGNRL